MGKFYPRMWLPILNYDISHVAELAGSVTFSSSHRAFRALMFMYEPLTNFLSDVRFLFGALLTKDSIYTLVPSHLQFLWWNDFVKAAKQIAFYGLPIPKCFERRRRDFLQSTRSLRLG